MSEGTSLQKRSGMARFVEGFHSFTCTSTRFSSNGLKCTCLCLLSRSWSSFTDPGGMEGWVCLGTTSVSKQSAQDRYASSRPCGFSEQVMTLWERVAADIGTSCNVSLWQDTISEGQHRTECTNTLDRWEITSASYCTWHVTEPGAMPITSKQLVYSSLKYTG